MDSEHIGHRIKYWRRRRSGMSQKTLADLAGVSQSFVSLVEAGLREVDRRSTLVNLAGALKVTVGELLGQPGDPTNPAQSVARETVPSVAAALFEVAAGHRHRIQRPAAQLAADLSALNSAALSSDHARVMPLLPDLIRDASADDRPFMLAKVSYVAADLLRFLGHRDLAFIASDVLRQSAQDADDPAWLGVASYMRMQVMPPESAAVTEQLGTRYADAIADRLDDDRVAQAYGMIHLRAALAGAVHRDAGLARAHLDEAAQIAARVGDREQSFVSMAFGPTNVGLWTMAVNMELGDPDAALAQSERLTPERLPLRNRSWSFRMCRARALIRVGGRDQEATSELVRAERIAPQLFRASVHARETVSAIMQRARHRSVPEDVRQLAVGLGMPVV